MGLPLVANLGVFTKANADIINNNFAAIAAPATPGRLWFVNANGGSNQGAGNTWDSALHTMGECFSRLSSGDIVYFCGQVREELTAPLGVSNVQIIGAGTRPRYGNESSFANPLNDRSAAWRPPATPTAATPLLILRQQGWVLANILFDCPVDAAAVMIKRQEDAMYPDPSSASFIGCQFSDGQNAIQDVGGCYNILIQGCSFRRITSRAIYCSSTGIALPLDWVVQNNIFEDCNGGITAALSNATIQNNVFLDGATYHYTNGKITTTGGVRNMIINNYTYDASADVDPAHGYTGVASDVWRTFAVDAADPVITSPPS